MIRAIRKKKFSRLRRLISCTKDRKNKGNDNCGETDSSSENQNKALNSAAKGTPSTPAKPSRRSLPSTPSTIPETSTPQNNDRTKDSAFVITYSDDYMLPPDSIHENATQATSGVAFARTGSFDQQPSIPDNPNNQRRKQEIATAFEIDQRQLVISTEDDIVSVPQDDSIDLDHVNRQLFQKLEESQKDVLASIVYPETIEESADEKGQKTFTKIPDHPALGNLEKYRLGLASGSPRRTSSTAKEVLHNTFMEESDRSMDKGSVSEGLKSIWDETTKNLESMNKAFSSCALDWKQEAQESFGEFAYIGEKGRNIPLDGAWLAVPDKHGEDISLLSYPKDIASISSRWTESQLDGIPVLRKETATIVEEDEPIQENSKSRYTRWL
mmetsp:Transcript_16949/g.41289  ORF Transcript_16949/g.41289 Transcript_16949/m.41289 type:complete len:384 (-) Transcript_16949:2638-3789(-)|eukprot:CAMPEP_0113607832 /NCGR_PEP_ID=MMETSP0017_2-20120614/3597_1 /TAXON_ID=2856 /ORGANISM="Cylindrotheca closterium" /LENGTH=383 /DNA_ID=CAMNT_0000516467 /DNA_START=386 /DNA_END=1537 /DNA_ORIENTATION=- /assembly_acc=CAM_ASM_000147